VAEHLGSDTFLHVHVDGGGLQTVRTEGENSFRAGDQVWLTPEPGRIYRFDRAGQALR
jgi:multiple sugar transport system ATP-binding protein